MAIRGNNSSHFQHSLCPQQPQSFEQCLVCERYNGAAVCLCVFLAELRGSVKVEVAVRGSPSLMVSLAAKNTHTETLKHAANKQVYCRLCPAGRTLSREQNSVVHSASRLSSLDSSSDAILSFPGIWAAASHTSSATHYCQLANVMSLQD